MTVMRLDWLLRLAVAGAFVGHGAYGAIVAKSTWFSYFAVVGIPDSVVTANGLVAVVGIAEIVAGLVSLVLPIPALLVVMAGWKIFSELLRPIAGELGFEFVERASNMMATPGATCRQPGESATGGNSLALVRDSPFLTAGSSAFAKCAVNGLAAVVRGNRALVRPVESSVAHLGGPAADI